MPGFQLVGSILRRANSEQVYLMHPLLDASDGEEALSVKPFINELLC